MSAGVIWLLSKASRQGRIRSWIPTLVLMSLCAAVVMAAAAGARRTDSAYPRFVEASNAPDVVIPYANANPSDPTQEPQTIAAIARLPQVGRSVIAYLAAMEGVTSTGVHVNSNSSLQPVAFADERVGRQLMRFKLLEGRLFDQRRSDEAVIGFSAAQRLGLHPGDTIHFRFFSRFFAPPGSAPPGNGPPGGAPPGGAPPGGAPPSGGPPREAGTSTQGGNPPATGPELTVKIVGVDVSAAPGDFAPVGSSSSSLWLTPAFAKAHPDQLTFTSLVVWLKRGQADVAAFKSATDRVANGALFYLNLAEQEATIQSSLHLQAVALGLFAALAAVVCLIVIAQAVARQVLASTGELPVLRSLGAGPGQLWLAAMVPAVAAAVAAAALAAVMATLLSPLTPLGLARNAEPDPGIAVDPTVLAVGAAVLVLVTALAAAYPAWRATRFARQGEAGDAGQPRLSSVAEAAARAGLPASAAAGIRLALTPGSRRLRVPVVAALAGCIVGVASSAAALTFRTSLDHLLATPRLFGWAWDAEVSPNLGPGVVAAPAGAAIRDVGRGTQREVAIDRERVGAYGIDAVKGSVPPVIVEGRAPQGSNEIVLGTRTDAGKAVGDTVTVGFGSTSRSMTLVGRALFPPQDEDGRMGVGAFMTLQAMRQLLGSGTGPGYDTFPVVFTPGTDVQREIHALQADYGGPGSVELPAAPTDLVNFGSVDQLPGVLAAVLIVAGIATLGHTLVMAVRRRRRDLAILKTLGFTRAQVASTVAWQSLTLIAVAVVIGLPAGIAAGRWAWSLFASAQGTVSEPVVPLLLVLLTVPAAIVLAELVALVPGRLAARTRPALVLRAE